jgi:type II secretory ATPase GspE/PulE/Tfp pilus assembly ATPase PilB-like protein
MSSEAPSPARGAWPAPPYFAYSRAEDAHLPCPCTLHRHDGQVRVGRLLRFLPDQNALEFQALDRSSSTLVDFGTLRSVRLTQPVGLVRREINRIEQAAVMPAQSTQTYRVKFRGGEEEAGETRGFVTEKYGLFLYPPSDADNSIRLFLPAQAMVSHSIGPSLGELLSDRAGDTVDFVNLGLQFQRDLRTQRIGDYLTANQIISRDKLEQALKGKEQTKPDTMLGQVLLKEKLVSQQELEEAVRRQQRDRLLPLGEILVEMGIIDRTTVNRLLVQKLGIPFVDPARFNAEPEAVRLLDKKLAEKHQVIPLLRTGEEIIVAMENPTAVDALHDLRFYTKLRVVPVMASRDTILAAIRKHYGQLEARNVKELASKLAQESRVEDIPDRVVTESDNALVRLVNQIILDAYERKVSDIHIEAHPGRQDTKIRFRQDGELLHYLEVPSGYRHALTSRIKIMANLDVAERRKPQDGKIDFSRFGAVKLELRVATMPTVGGVEDVVLRLLSGAEAIPLERLGLRSEALTQLKRIAGMPHGLILICGPTGSGKTTTLHSVLGTVNNGQKKIWTAEDPIEITQPGLRQVQVNPKIGLTFAAAMRSFLRLDPDVIMVGEMRDAETAKVGIEASLTGHLVLSTLHTNSAAESIVRLLDLGMDPFNFADALQGVLSQRLARALCDNCKRAHLASSAEVDALLDEYCGATNVERQSVLKRWTEAYGDSNGRLQLHDPGGCEQCQGRGYRGRMALHELLVTSRDIKRLVQSRATAEQIQAVAMREGMLTLKQDGIEKVLQGRTDVTQIRAVAV